MKKYVTLARVLVLTLSMAGCFGRGNDDTQPADTIPMPSTNYTTEPTTRPTEPPQTVPTESSTHSTMPSQGGMTGENGSTDSGIQGGTGNGSASGGM